jgi:hypothetical protein
MKGLWRLRSLKVQGSNNCLRLSALVSGHLVKTGTCPAMENNSLFLIGTFITLSRAYEGAYGKCLVRLMFVTMEATD